MSAVQPPDDDPPPSHSPISHLPPDLLSNILLRLSLRDAALLRPTSRLFNDSLSPSFLSLLPPHRLLLLRHPRPSASPSLHAFDPTLRRWLRLPLPLASASPVAASPSLLFLWADPAAFPSTPGANSSKSLVVCNPLAGGYRVLPPLGSAWSRHGTVLAGPNGSALVLTELAALSYKLNAADSVCTSTWRKHPLSLPSKPRSPILANDAVFALCDVGTPWRSQWKLFSCPVARLTGGWHALERHGWGDVFEILKRPRLLVGAGGRRVLMVGGLRSSFALDAPCSTVLILRLDLETMEWGEAGRMPPEMYRAFSGSGDAAVGAGVLAATGGNNKVKVLGGDGMVWFSGKRVRGKLAMWEEDVGSSGGVWSWIEGVSGYGDGVYRGFVFDAGFTAMP